MVNPLVEDVVVLLRIERHVHRVVAMHQAETSAEQVLFQSFIICVKTENGICKIAVFVRVLFPRQILSTKTVWGGGGGYGSEGRGDDGGDEQD